MSVRDRLRAVRNYQRPLHDPKQTFTEDRVIVIEGVPITIQGTAITVTNECESCKEALKSTLSIM